MENSQDKDPVVIDEVYKHLGVKQVRKVDHRTMEEMFAKRVRLVLQTHLNSKNVFKPLNT